MLRRVASAVHGAVEPKALRAEGGDPAAVIDFSSNQSPLGAAPAVAAAVATAVVDAYPDRCAGALCEAIARVVDVPSPSVVAGNGSTELIRLIAQLALAPGQHAVALGPSFGEYEVATLLCGAQFHEVRPTHFGSGSGFCHDEAMLARILAGELVRLCWICSPNNPTGGVIAPGVWCGWCTITRAPCSFSTRHTATCWMSRSGRRDRSRPATSSSCAR